MTIDANRLRALLSAATQRQIGNYMPWHTSDNGSHTDIEDSEDGFVAHFDVVEDGELACGAVNALPDLLDRLDALAARISTLEEAFYDQRVYKGLCIAADIAEAALANQAQPAAAEGGDYLPMGPESPEFAENDSPAAAEGGGVG